MADVMADLVSNVVNISYRDLPPQTIEMAKKCIYNSVAVTVAGASFPGVDKIVDQFRDWGGKAESTIIMYGDRVPTRNAVIPNCYMARAWDYEEFDERTAWHLSAGIVPAAIAAAEMVGGVSGERLITAVTLGFDTFMRMALAKDTMKYKVEVPTASVTYAPFGVVAAVGKLMGLNESQMLNAMGLAGCHLPIVKAGSLGSYLMLTKNLGFGLAADTGVTAVKLSLAGVTGPTEPLEGPRGFYAFYEKGNFIRKRVLERLGQVFELDTICLKAYPCFGQTIPSAYTTVEVMKKNGIRAEDIKEIKTYVDDSAYLEMVEPVAARRRPTGLVAAQWSLPYVVATAALRGSVKMGDFTESAIKDPTVLQMAELVNPQVDQELNDLSTCVVPGKVEITTKNGRVYKGIEPHYKGHWQNPLTFDDLAAKFRECASYGSRPLPDTQTERAVSMLNNLEKTQNVSTLVEQLVIKH